MRTAVSGPSRGRDAGIFDLCRWVERYLVRKYRAAGAVVEFDEDYKDYEDYEDYEDDGDDEDDEDYGDYEDDEDDEK